MQNVSIWNPWIEVFLTGINNSQNFNTGCWFMQKTVLFYFNSTINPYFATYCCFIICVEQHLLLRSVFDAVSIMGNIHSAQKLEEKRSASKKMFYSFIYFCCNLKRLSRPQQLFQRLCSTFFFFSIYLWRATVGFSWWKYSDHEPSVLDVTFTRGHCLLFFELCSVCTVL